MVIIFPLALSLVAAGMFALGEAGLFTKLFIVTLVVSAAALQFVPALAERVHFLISLFMQLIVCGWWYFASQFE